MSLFRMCGRSVSSTQESVIFESCWSFFQPLFSLTVRILQNVVDSETRVEELRLEYNALVSLDGALSGVQGLERLNISHNLLTNISPDDLIGLDQLRTLDVSFNRLHTLEETSKVKWLAREGLAASRPTSPPSAALLRGRVQHRCSLCPQTFMPALEELMASHNQLQALERDFHGLPALCRADLSSNNISRIHPELTTRTRCKVHGVNSVLRIALHGTLCLSQNLIKSFPQNSFYIMGF